MGFSMADADTDLKKKKKAESRRQRPILEADIQGIYTYIYV